MEEKHLILIGLILTYILVVYLFSRIGGRREIGKRRLFWISLFLTPLLGFAFFISSQHKKLVLYTEKRYKCEDCGYVFSEESECCPMCEKEGKINPLKKVDMYMT
ncbi:MAG TPA: hypothetical protein P5514_12305 [Bacteroidales bacterium]|nr:hypothetical protein [Bacteroidales bacterium]HPE57128.1 hypothetical protein [Bacteroidales bacterium]HRX97721.1 hypothetical protein [Bacteroidales bacterium]